MSWNFTDVMVKVEIAGQIGQTERIRQKRHGVYTERYRSVLSGWVNVNDRLFFQVQRNIPMGSNALIGTLRGIIDAMKSNANNEKLTCGMLFSIIFSNFPTRTVMIWSPKLFSGLLRSTDAYINIFSSSVFGTGMPHLLASLQGSFVYFFFIATISSHSFLSSCILYLISLCNSSTPFMGTPFSQNISFCCVTLLGLKSRLH